MKLLEQTVRELKGEDVEDDVRADGEPAGRPARSTSQYIPDMNQRLMVYRQMARRGATTSSIACSTRCEIGTVRCPPRC